MRWRLHPRRVKESEAKERYRSLRFFVQKTKRPVLACGTARQTPKPLRVSVTRPCGRVKEELLFVFFFLKGKQTSVSFINAVPRKRLKVGKERRISPSHEGFSPPTRSRSNRSSNRYLWARTYRFACFRRRA